MGKKRKRVKNEKKKEVKENNEIILIEDEEEEEENYKNYANFHVFKKLKKNNIIVIDNEASNEKKKRKNIHFFIFFNPKNNKTNYSKHIYINYMNTYLEGFNPRNFNLNKSKMHCDIYNYLMFSYILSNKSEFLEENNMYLKKRIKLLKEKCLFYEKSIKDRDVACATQMEKNKNLEKENEELKKIIENKELEISRIKQQQDNDKKIIDLENEIKDLHNIIAGIVEKQNKLNKNENEVNSLKERKAKLSKVFINYKYYNKLHLENPELNKGTLTRCVYDNFNNIKKIMKILNFTKNNVTTKT